MAISMRTLNQWRREALHKLRNPLLITNHIADGEKCTFAILEEKEYNNRILILTQELQDIILLQPKEKR